MIHSYRSADFWQRKTDRFIQICESFLMKFRRKRTDSYAYVRLWGVYESVILNFYNMREFGSSAFQCKSIWWKYDQIIRKFHSFFLDYSWVQLEEEKSVQLKKSTLREFDNRIIILAGCMNLSVATVPNKEIWYQSGIHIMLFWQLKCYYVMVLSKINLIEGSV